MNKVKHVICSVVVCIIILLCLFFVGRSVLYMLFPLNHSETILDSCEDYNLDPYLVCALIKAESNFVTDAKSNKNALGLMQITETTAQWITEKTDYKLSTTDELTQPEINIQLGTWYLRYLLTLYHDNTTLALCAYNAGHGNVDNWLSNRAYSEDGVSLNVIPFKETKDYIEKIQHYVHVYRILYPDI